MSNFWKRTLFGSLFVIIVIGSAMLGEYALLTLLALISALGLWELYGLCEKDGIYPQKITGIVLGMVPFLFAFIGNKMGDDISRGLILFFFFFPFLLFFMELRRKKSKPFANIALTLFGVIYIPVTLFLFYVISVYPSSGDFVFGDYVYTSERLLGYFFILWSYDTGAYLAGSKFGKHKLWERLSPGKTWEGVAGGAVLALAVAYIISGHFTDFSRINWFTIAVIIMITGTLGDLTKSMFKRSINVKDSGTIIPGHGGIIDRFDALFLSAPFVFCYIFLVK